MRAYPVVTQNNTPYTIGSAHEAFSAPHTASVGNNRISTEYWFDLPAVAVEDNGFAGGQVSLGSEIETGRRPSLALFVVDGAPYGSDRMAVEKSCFGDDGLETDLLPFPVNYVERRSR